MRCYFVRQPSNLRQKAVLRFCSQHLRSWIGCIVPALLLVLCAAALHAQFRASIQGTVTDTTGGVIPGAVLTLTDVDTNRVMTATTNGSGVYNFNALGPDHYNLTAEAKGFNKKVIADIRIIPEQPNAIDVQLVIGDVGTVVNVAGDAIPALDTETASISGTISSNEIQHMPSANRDVFQLVQLAPGVFGDGSQGAGGGTNNLPGTQGPGGSNNNQGIFATENGPQAVANGGQYENNSISIDGISTVSAVWGGTSVITPTEDSIGNVKIVSNGYDAENARFSGAQIQVTSKSGTNQFHGSLFFQAHRPGLNAYQRYNGPGSLVPGTPSSRGLIRDTQQFNQYGGSAGGPIWKNRIFAFFAYETERNNSSVTTNQWYETPDFHSLAPANSIAAQFLSFPGSNVAANSVIEETCANEGLVEGVNCHYIPGKGLNLGSPIPLPLGQPDPTYVSGTDPGIGGGLSDVATIAFYNTRNPTSAIFEQYNGRLDADASHADHIAFAIYWVPSSTTSYQGTVRPQNLWHHEQTNDAFSAIWNHTFSPSLLNEARGNAAGWRWNEVASNPQAPFGLPQTYIAPPGAQSTTQVVGSIQSQNIAFFGAPGPSDFNQWTYTYKDVATKVLGNHTVKFGGDVTRLYYLNNPTYSARPTYNFYSYWNFLNDAPGYETGSFSPLTGEPTTNRQDDRVTIYGFFIQDDWKAAPNLTINMGLRYAYFGSLSSKEDNLNTVVLGTGAATYTDMYIRRGGNLYKSQKGNFGPQFGFAWSPQRFNNRFVVRGGFGLNFNQEEIAISGNSGSNPPSVVTPSFQSGPYTVNPQIIYAVAPTSTSLFGYPPNPNTVSPFNSANLPLVGTPQITAFPATMPTIYSYHYSFDTQYDLGYHMVATVGYQGGLGRHIIIQQNRYVSAVAEGVSLNPLISAIDYYGNDGASSNNALLLGIKHQMARQFSVDAEFQWAKAMDQGSGPYYEDPYPFRPDLAYGRSDYNVSKAFKLYGIWQPHLWHGNYFVGLLANGWSISGIFNVHTGFPWTPIDNVSGGNLYYAQSNYNQLRPAAYLGGAGSDHSNDAYKSGPGVGNGQNKNFPLAATQTGTAYFSVPAIDMNRFPQLPGVSRNSQTGPGYLDLDGTLTKAFALPHGRVIGENAAIEIRADAFNFLNNLNFLPSSVSSTITATNFGQASSALSGRIVNLQARFSF